MEFPMRKILLSAAVAAAGLIALPAFAQDSSGYLPTQTIGSGSWFLDAGIGRTGSSTSGGFGSNIGNDFNFGKSQRGRKTGYNLFGGYRWKLGPNLALGLEAGYADLGNFKLQNTFNGDKIDQTSTTQALRGWLVGTNGRINLATQWYLSARGGFFHANGSDHIYDNVDQNLGEFTTAKAGRNGWYAGVGTGWDIDEHWGVGLSYDYYHANAGRVRLADQEIATLKRSTSILSLTGEYRF
jgi:OOP family OmpA-OmpF porin/outer membrane immunogenic protein